MTTPNRPPLWQVMHEAWCAAEPFCDPLSNVQTAYMIRALRDWLVPETTHPGEFEFWPDADVEREWQYAQRLRALLTTEADRAERGIG